jgi:predicted Rossmann-fold nucleotide-binding protein
VQGVRNARYYEQARQFARLVAARATSAPRPSACTSAPAAAPASWRRPTAARTTGRAQRGPEHRAAARAKRQPYISPSLCFKFHYFALRKMHFMMRAKALVAFPGGFGTLDELFEVLTLVQTRKAKPVPIVLFGTDYWKRLINFDLMVEEGTISAEDLGLFHFADEPLQAGSRSRPSTGCEPAGPPAPAAGRLQAWRRWPRAPGQARAAPTSSPRPRTPNRCPPGRRPSRTAWASARWRH